MPHGEPDPPQHASCTFVGTLCERLRGEESYSCRIPQRVHPSASHNQLPSTADQPAPSPSFLVLPPEVAFDSPPRFSSTTNGHALSVSTLVCSTQDNCGSSESLFAVAGTGASPEAGSGKSTIYLRDGSVHHSIILGRPTASFEICVLAELIVAFTQTSLACCGMRRGKMRLATKVARRRHVRPADLSAPCGIEWASYPDEEGHWCLVRRSL